MASNIGGGNLTFKAGLDEGIPPKISALTCNSLFSKYTFDVIQNSTELLLDLSLQIHQSLNPFTLQLEKYLSIGLLGSEDGKNHRENLNLVIALDISGSMNEVLSKKSSRSKLALAISCVKNIFNKLTPEERIALITFNKNSTVIQDLNFKKNIIKENFFKSLDKLKAKGGTSLEVGYQPAIDMLQKQIIIDANEDPSSLIKPKNHRIIFITDAMISDQSEADNLLKLNYEASKFPQNIFTSFIGVGVDFDTDLISKLTKVRGSNYFSAHSDEEFSKILERDFNYIVTPLAFNVYGQISSQKFEIQRTYGSDFDIEENPKEDLLMEMKKGGVLRIDTLTAYEKSYHGVKGGIILVHLKEKEEVKNDEMNEDYNIVVSVDYEDLNGKKHEMKKIIDAKLLKELDNQEFYQCSGGRKALLLSRYVNFVRERLEKKSPAKLEQDIEMRAFFNKEIQFVKDPILEEEFSNLKKIIKMKL